MKLAQPFYRLPLAFDAARLREEVAQFAEQEWQRHPTGYNGNSAIRLISVEGGENDAFAGPMQPTPALARCPYIAQVLASFGVVWSRSRLMRLAAGAVVPKHCDLNYHWMHRLRIHIPVLTNAAVHFTCGGVTVNMAAGEAWTFDNWRPHEVRNGSPRERIHLVADTCGDADFWAMLNGAADFRSPPQAVKSFAWQPGVAAKPLCERHNVSIVMPPSEVEQLVSDLLSDLAPPADPWQASAVTRFTALGVSLAREWRTLWSLYADGLEGWPHYARLREQVQAELQRLPQNLPLASNGANAGEVFTARVLVYLFYPPQSNASNTLDLDRTLSAPAPAAGKPRARVERPIFIVAAPRSGSTLLFETLAQAKDLWTLGGEAHWLVENFEQLRPLAEGVDSNRLTAAHATEQIQQKMLEVLAAGLRDRQETGYDGSAVRWLEKTPKNALRVPFFKTLFPDARFIHLWRDPRENLASIIEAWHSGGWVTYPQLPGWQGPWSLLLPPGWQAMQGRPLEEVAAFQWARTNSILLDDLAVLPASDSICLSYKSLLANPAAAMQKLCAFAGVEVDAGLINYLARPLPLARHTLQAPARDKWRKHQAAIESVMPRLLPLVDSLEASSNKNGSSFYALPSQVNRP